MSDFSSDDQNELARMEALAEEKPASELKEVLEPGQVVKKAKMPDFKTRLNALKAKAGAIAPKVEEKLPESVPTQVEAKPGYLTHAQLHPGVEVVPGDMGKPQNTLEALVEADRQFVAKVTDEHVEASSEKMLTAEALFTESLAEKSMDRERFKAVFINTVQQECAGLTLDQIEESIRRDHEVLFDKRTGIQAKLAYRAELLKDATAEERAKRLKDDWLFKPNKKTTTNGEEKPKKSSGPKKAAFDPAAAMRAALKAKGLTDEQIAERLAKFGL